MNPIDGSLTQGVKPAQATETPKPNAATVKAARDFEAMLLRQMLSCLERTTKSSQKGPMTGGGDVHASMMISALADALAAAGGLGLSDMIVRAGDLGGQKPAGESKRPSSEEGAKGFREGAVPRVGSHTS